MKAVRLLLSVLFVFLAGFIGSIFTMPAIPTWYAVLNKPSFNPPNWIFGPVWTGLYLLMAIAFFLIWEKRQGQKAVVDSALTAFIVQLVLNSLWSVVFFGWHLLALAFVEMAFLWLAILWTIIRFYRISRLAAWLLIPYILWVSFAAVLNLAVAILN